jgi:hypothetical protein
VSDIINVIEDLWLLWLVIVWIATPRVISWHHTNSWCWHSWKYVGLDKNRERQCRKCHMYMDSDFFDCD